jgi:hypothetical protein
MKQWKVIYETKDGDTSSIWVYAHTEEGAELQAKREHWDIVEIIQITQL